MILITKNKKLFLVFLSILIITVLNYFFGWTAYVNSEYGFFMHYPYRWSYEVNPEPPPNVTFAPFTVRWYIEDPPPHYGSGRSFPGQEVFLYVFSPSDKEWQKRIQQTNDLTKTNRPGLVRVDTIKMTVANQKVKAIVAPGAIWVGPILHKGQLYYFTGNNDDTVRKMLSSFTFTK